MGETAQLLGVSDDLVYELVARGELPRVRLGRRKVIPRAAIELVVNEALAGFDTSVVRATLTTPRVTQTAAPVEAPAVQPTRP
ncbi:MAG: helix-turn-helix domain-containing protein [Actinomycetota bacterium]|nr:helix-turn-helix domain-containing protein [Actinomycetota bacterium]